ncbi:hypothetical protein NNO95_04865 [Acinetobacter baumannii]|uniref:hypothetical protein n=1 Tax=Acinetobacter baumannii TaxID=470 RepID=UPI0020CF4EC8|nr:hypothetical protein [Acinetobacter baumannii]MCQ1053701.1 hypothetical protein [Acinetobacter baumannii]
MSYYIQGASGQFVSGLYYSESEAQRGIERYIQQQAKRYTTNLDRVTAVGRLRQSLKIVMNHDDEPPVQAVYMLRDEILRRIEKAEPGTIYSRPLLLGMITTRVMGKVGQYFEVTATMKERALSDLFNPVAAKKSGVLIEKDGIITRSGEMIPYSPPISGWFKTYLSRV